jgi:type I restriction enzyme S subunit
MNNEWTTVPLGELAVHRGGSTNPAKFQDDLFELYSVPAYDRGKPDILIGKDIGSAKKNVEPNDVLLSRIVPHIQRVWIVGNKGNIQQIASGEWIIYRSNKFYPPFLRYALLTKRFHVQFMRTISGVGGSLLRARPDLVAQIEIPFPPLAEQKRIASILDKADAIRSKRRQAIQLTNEFLQSVFLDMFGDPVINPNKWDVKSIGSIAIKFSDGPFGSNLKTSHYVDAGIRVLRLQNIGVDEFLNDDKMYISLTHFRKLIKHRCTPGDLIIGTLGDPNLRGCILPPYISEAINKADCIQLRVDPYQATAEYVCSLINQKGMLTLAYSLMHGQTRTRISMGTLKNLDVPVPPISKQKSFSIIYNRQKKLILKNKKMSIDSDKLFVSLTQKAYRGEL